MNSVFFPDPNRPVRHTDYICLRDLFPGKSVQDADQAMVMLAELMEMWLRAHGNHSIKPQWTNILERDTNPDGTVGRFRFIPIR